MRFQSSTTKNFGNPLFSQNQKPSWVVHHPRCFGFFVIICISGVVYFMYGLPYWRITTLTVQGTYTLPAKDLREVTLRQMQGRWLFVFRQNRLFAFDTQAYERRLRERWIFSELHVERKMPGTIAVTLTEEKPAFLFLQAPQLFGVDRKGVLSTIMSQAVKEIPTITYDQQPQNPVLGTAVLPQDDADFFLRWYTALAARNIPALSLVNIHITAAPDQTAKLRVAGEWDILTDRTQPVQKQIDAFFTAYDQKLQGRNLQYVDVTVPARVYYK